MTESYNADKPQSRRSQYRIMVVEDSQVLYKVIKSQLERLGLGVDYADNGFEAVRLYQTEDDVAILMDCQMPVMDGYEATGIIRALEQKRGGRVPIIAMTATSSMDSCDNCLEAGMDDYMTKPFAPVDLARTLIKWVPELKSVILLPEGGEETQLVQKNDKSEVIDLQQMKAYVGDDEEVRQFVINDYLKNSHERMESLRHAVTSKNAPEIKRLAHSFKAVNAFVGAQVMVDILKAMEDHAPREEISAEEHLFVELVRNHDLVYQALAGLKQSKT